MNSHKKTEIKTTTLRIVLLQILLFILITNVISGIIAKRGLDYIILTTISSLVGMGISITIVYYLVNKKSFGPIEQTKGNILILFTLPFFLIISLGVYFALDFLVNLF